MNSASSPMKPKLISFPCERVASLTFAVNGRSAELGGNRGFDKQQDSATGSQRLVICDGCSHRVLSLVNLVLQFRLGFARCPRRLAKLPRLRTRSSALHKCWHWPGPFHRRKWRHERRGGRVFRCHLRSCAAKQPSDSAKSWLRPDLSELLWVNSAYSNY